MTRIFLIRHAESEGNTYRRAHGHFNGQITTIGYAQIKELRNRFTNEKIDVIYSSDLDRTVITAASLSEPRGLQINKNKKLREVDLGVWEDTAWGDLEHYEPEMISCFNNDPSSWNVPGGEDYESVQSRMLSFINEIGEKHIGETVAVFSHGFAIRSLMCNLLDIKSEHIHKVPYFDNTGVALLIYDDGVLTVEYHGDNSHLPDEISTFSRQTWWREGHEKVKENLRYKKIGSEACSENVGTTMGAIIDKVKFNLGYLAFLDNEPVGLLALDDCPGDVGKIIYSYIKPKYKDRNFHEQLIGQVISVFRKLNKKVIQIDVSNDDVNEIEFLSKHGFNKVSDEKKHSVMELKL